MSEKRMVPACSSVLSLKVPGQVEMVVGNMSSSVMGGLEGKGPSPPSTH